MLPLDAQLEAILFYRPEPINIDKLAELLACPKEEVITAIETLKEKLLGRGLTVVENNEMLVLGTAPAASDLIEKITKEELSSEIGKAGLETLALILYRGPISRSGIDYIRGVNSSYILRNLLVRGLIEKTNSEGEGRGFVYGPSLDLLRHLGVSKIEDLPDYGSVQVKVEEFIKSRETETTDHAS